jgi:hypothetical protein
MMSLELLVTGFISSLEIVEAIALNLNGLI